MTARGLVFQCGACRSLVRAEALATDAGSASPMRAGLPCDACGAVTWLPFGVSGSGAHVVDVDVRAASVGAALQLAPGSTALTTLTPASMATTATMALASAFGDDARGRIHERLRKLAPAGSVQEDLSTSFERLLAQWHSDAEHRAFLQKASLAGELAFAGQRYRAVLEEAPNDAPAKRAQGELLTLAMASMGRNKDMDMPQSATSRTALAVAVLLITVLVCGAIVVFLPRLLRADADDTPAVEER